MRPAAASEQVKIKKGLRKLSGDQGSEEIDVFCKGEVKGVINIKALADNIKAMLNYQEDFTSAQFAITMIEGSQKIRFCKK